MADELQQVANDKRDQCPRRRILVVPDEKMDRQDERDRQAQQMKELVAGMEMPFRVVLEESLHEFAVQFARSPVFQTGLSCSPGLENRAKDINHGKHPSGNSALIQLPSRVL